MMEPILIIDNLSKYFPLKTKYFWQKQQLLKANEKVSFSINEGECIGIVGESGCGKSTLGKTLMNLYTKTSGEVFIKNPHYQDDDRKVDFDGMLSLIELLKKGLEQERFYKKLDDDFLKSFLRVYGFEDWQFSYKRLDEVKQAKFTFLCNSLANPKYYPIHHLKEKKLRQIRALIQMIFQDPLSSLNPTFNVEKILTEPFVIAKEKFDKSILIDLVNKVGLDEKDLVKYPHEFSGGQQQRIAIARSLARSSKIIICDEPVSALDVSVQAQILNLLVKFQKDLNLTLLFISHNLAVVKYLADKIVVMYLGKVVEIASAEDIYKYPKHPYTESLLKAIPSWEIGVSVDILQGDVSNAVVDQGCAFAPRCPYVKDRCHEDTPTLLNGVACHYPLN